MTFSLKQKKLLQDHICNKVNDLISKQGMLKSTSGYMAPESKNAFHNATTELFNLTRSTLCLADSLLAKNDKFGSNYQYAEIDFNNNCPDYNVFAPDVFANTMGTKALTLGNIRLPLRTIFSKFSLGYEKDVELDPRREVLGKGLVAQALIDAENKEVVNKLDISAKANGKVIKSNQLTKDIIIEIKKQLESTGNFISACVCSTDIVADLNNLGDLDPFTTFRLFNNIGGGVQPDLFEEGQLSFIQQGNFMGIDWYGIPFADYTKLINKGTAYFITSPERLGKFARIEYRVPTISVHTGNFQADCSAIEKFASIVLNKNGVIKLELDN